MIQLDDLDDSEFNYGKINHTTIETDISYIFHNIQRRAYPP